MGAGNPTPKASNIMSSLLNDNVGFMMGPSIAAGSPNRKRGPSPSSFQGVENTPQKRRAAYASPGPPLRRDMGPGYSPNPVRKAKDDFSGIGGVRRRSSLEPPKPTSM